MIDYLEEALAEDRAEESLSGGRRAVLRPPEDTPPEDPESAGTKLPRGRVPRPSERAQADSDEVLAQPPAPAAAPEEDPEPPPSSEDGVPEALREVLRRKSWLPRPEDRSDAAGILLQALSRTGRSLRALRSGPGIMTVTLPGEVREEAGGDLEALDLAMQRDARRYDGGFQLY